MALNRKNNVSYGLSQALIDVSPAPIVSMRNPHATDSAPLGQMWINRTTGIAFILTAISANSYTWYATAQVAASYTAAGELVAGTSLSVGTTATIGGELTVTAGGFLVSGNSDIFGTLGVTGDVVLGKDVAVGGDLYIGTAAKRLIMPGPIVISTGAGAPAAGLAVEAGDIYIRTDPAGATSRIYIATSANVWSNVDCAA